MTTVSLICDRCADSTNLDLRPGSGLAPGSVCGRDLSEELGLPEGSRICNGHYEAKGIEAPEPLLEANAWRCYHCGDEDMVLVAPCEEHRRVRGSQEGRMVVDQDADMMLPDGSGEYIFCRSCNGKMSVPEYQHGEPEDCDPQPETPLGPEPGDADDEEPIYF